MTVKSFGCSFIFGTELSDCAFNSSKLTWPALIAQKYGVDYQCYAKPGSGNLFILNSILNETSENDLCLINWTWIDRYDYIKIDNEQWESLRPANSNDLEKFYFKHLHSQYKDMLTNLGYVKLAIDYLNNKRIRFIMTYMDYLLFEPVLPSWHTPNAVTYLQDQVKPHLTNFNSRNFLDWSNDNGYRVSDQWHPLEEAHAAAAQYLLDQNLV